MAVTLYLSDGTTTFQLNNGTGCEILANGYAPRDPEPILYEIEDSAADGRDLASSVYPNVTEPVHVKFLGAGLHSAARTNRDAMRALLTQAHNYVRDPVTYDPVYIYFGEASGATLWEARLMGGSWQPDPDNLNGKGKMEAGIITGVITWTRWPIWSNSGTAMSAMFATTNIGEPVDVGTIEGEWDGPAVIHATNPPGQDTIDTLYIGMSRGRDPSDYTTRYEGAAVTLPQMEETVVGKWLIPGKHLTAAGGKQFRAMGRLDAYPSDVRLRWELYSHGARVWYGRQFVLTRERLQPLGPPLKLPPWDTHGRRQGSHTLVLQAISASGGLLSLPDLYLLPADGWRELHPHGLGIVSGGKLVDDPARGNPSIEIEEDGEAVQVGHYRAVGRTLTLAPYQEQALFPLWDTLAGSESRLEGAIGHRAQRTRFEE